MRRRPGGTVGAVYVLTLFLACASTELAAGRATSSAVFSRRTSTPGQIQGSHLDLYKSHRKLLQDEELPADELAEEEAAEEEWEEEEELLEEEEERAQESANAGEGETDLDRIDEEMQDEEVQEEGTLVLEEPLDSAEAIDEPEAIVEPEAVDETEALEEPVQTQAKRLAAEYDDYEEDDEIPELMEDDEAEFDAEGEKDFEEMIKAEAHQEALNTGENPASLAAGTRNVTANSTIAAVTGVGLSEGAAQASEAADLDVQSEDLDWDDELASMELEEEEEEERAYEQELKMPTLPDDSIQRAIDAHTSEPLPLNRSSASTQPVANSSEKDTLETIQDLTDVVGEDDLDSYLAEERELGAERLEELTDDSPPSPTIVYKAPVVTVKSESRPVKSESFATTAVEPKPLATPEPQGNSSVIAQSVIMGGALKDAVGASVAIRVIAIIIAAVAGCAVAWGSIVLYNRLRPPNQNVSLPKVIEIGAFTKKSPAYTRVKPRGEEHQSGNWQDWDDDWDDQTTSQTAARRGSSVKQKRSQQKWDEDW